MKKFFKVLLYAVLFIALAIGGLLIYINSKGIPRYEPQAIDLSVEITPERVLQGKKLANTLCVECHYDENTGKLTGKFSADLPPEFGKIYSRNITQDNFYGIGKWSDGDIVRLLRTGVRPDGEYLPAYMPKFPLMADEDIYSVVAWLRSDDERIQASTIEAPASEPSLLTYALTQFVMKPYPLPTQAITVPDSNDAVALGRYLATGQLACYACHSKDFKDMNELEPEKSLGFFGGGNHMLRMDGSEIITPNITMNKEKGIGNYTKEQFIEAVKFGKTPKGQVGYPMVPYVHFTEKEIGAIYEYLKTVPVI